MIMLFFNLPFITRISDSRINNEYVRRGEKIAPFICTLLSIEPPIEDSPPSSSSGLDYNDWIEPQFTCSRASRDNKKIHTGG